MSLDDRNAVLNQEMENHPAEESIQVLVRDAGRRKLQLRILSISVILNILLTIGFGYVTYKTNELARLAQSNKDAVIANCEISNDSRERNRTLWAYLLSLPTTQVITPEQQTRRDDFKAFVDETFALRNCQAEVE